MMKVPTYRSQAQLSGKSGGIQFGVQASPDMFSQSARAQTNLFATMEKAATGFLEAETKAQREADLITAQNSWNAQNLTDTADLSKMNSGQIISTYGARQKNNTKTVSSSISDKVVRKRFDEWSQTAKVQSDGNVNKIYRSKWVDEGKAQYAVKVRQLENQIFSGSKAQQAQARLELYGNPVTGAAGVFQQQAELGYIDFETAVKSEAKSRSNVLGLYIRKELSKFNQDEDSAGARDLYTSLMDASNTQWADLDLATRQSLADSALTLSEQIDKVTIARDNAADAKAARDLKRTQGKNAATYLSTIYQSRAQESGSGQTGASEPLPTLDTIISDLADSRLDKTGFTAVMNALTGDQAFRDTPQVVAGILEKLQNAETPTEIDAVIKDAQGKIGIQGGLTLPTFNGFVAQAQTYKDRTPYAIDTKRYLTALKGAIGEGVVRNFAGKQDNPNRELRQSEAIAYYHRRVNDPLNPASPKEAYREVLANYRRAAKDDLITTAPSATVISSWNNSPMVSGGSAMPFPTDVSKWTARNFNDARSVVSSLPSRSQDPISGMTVIEKAIEMEKLDYIEDEAINLARLQKMEQDEKNRAAQAANGSTEPEDDGFSISDWFGSILGNDSEETVDDIRSAF